MNRERFEEYIKRVAQNNNITPEEVLKDIEYCIKESAEAVLASKDPEVLKSWQQIPKTGESPTPYEFISHIAKMVLQQRTDRKNS